jgi:hypothetical protein
VQLKKSRFSIKFFVKNVPKLFLMNFNNIWSIKSNFYKIKIQFYLFLPNKRNIMIDFQLQKGSNQDQIYRSKMIRVSIKIDKNT